MQLYLSQDSHGARPRKNPTPMQLRRLDSRLAALHRQLRVIERQLPSRADTARAELESAIAAVGDMLAMGTSTTRVPAPDDEADLHRAGAQSTTVANAEHLFRNGRWDELERRLDEFMRRPIGPATEMRVACITGCLHGARGNFGLARSHFERSRMLSHLFGSLGTLAALYVGYAELELWCGQADVASAWIDQGMRAASDHGGISALYSMGARVAADRAECARSLGDSLEVQRREQVAGDFYERASATDGRQTPNSPAHLATCRAEAARAAGRADPTLWKTAVLMWTRSTRPYAAAYAGFRHAEALMKAGTEGPRVQLVLEQARLVSMRLAAKPLTRQLCALAARGHPDTTVQVTDPPMTAVHAHELALGNSGLTKREFEVLRLVVVGMTNREISRALFISKHTVGVHVSHILAKLGVKNRVMAAAAGHRLGLSPPAFPNRAGDP